RLLPRARQLCTGPGSLVMRRLATPTTPKQSPAGRPSRAFGRSWRGCSGARGAPNDFALKPAHQPLARMTPDRLGTDGPPRLLIDPHVGRRQPLIAGLLPADALAPERERGGNSARIVRLGTQGNWAIGHGFPEGASTSRCAVRA